MIQFNYNDNVYVSDWKEGVVQIPSGIYLTADFVDGKPENIHQVKYFVAPMKYATAKKIQDK